MGNTTIRLCSVSEIASDPSLPALLSAYGQESAIDGLGEPDAQIDTYRTMEASGVLKIVGAFTDGTLVGFLILLVSTLPHYGKRIGSTESFFVSPAVRKRGIGLRLLRTAEQLAAAQGAVGFFVSAPVNSRLAEVLDAHKPYRETNRVFFRVLE